MKAFFMRYFLIGFCFVFFSCSSSGNDDVETNNPSQTAYEWTVPLVDLLGNFNPFPLAENPVLEKVSTVEGINDDQTVIVISIENQINIYPLHFIHSYEVINDQINGSSFIISYCPITQSTASLVGNYNNEHLTFRASGILYKENLVMHDAISDTYWSQMLLTCIKGKYADNQIENLAMIETSWKIAKTYFPDGNVFTSSSIINSKKAKATTEINNDEKVFGIINQSSIKSSDVSIYRYGDFKNGITKHTNLSAQNDIIVGSEEMSFIAAFQNTSNLNLTVLQNEFPTILIDETGIKYDVFGNVVGNSNSDKALQPSTGYIAAWWAWQDFYESFNFVE